VAYLVVVLELVAIEAIGRKAVGATLGSKEGCEEEGACLVA